MKIEGVKVIQLKPHIDDRGYLIEILRTDDPHFVGFGQTLLSTCYPGIVKAWEAHRERTHNFFVVKGNAKIGLYDGRPHSPTYGETDYIVIGEQNAALVQVPPLVWHGFTALGTEMAFLIDISNTLYNHANPDMLRRRYDDPEIGFDWSPKSR